MPKPGWQLIPILAVVLFGLTACGDSDSKTDLEHLRVEDRIWALEKKVERLEENGEFIFICANNHSHPTGISLGNC